MEDGRYFACPKCKSLSKGDGWYDEVKVYQKQYVAFDRSGDWNIVKVKEEDIETIRTIHECPGAGEYEQFYSENYYSEEFGIKIENGKIVEANDYYLDHPDDLVAVAEANNLEISEELMKELGIEKEEEFEI